MADSSLRGRARFRLVSKYIGATTPTGRVRFQFKKAGLDFHSANYEWLAISTDSSNAQLRGTGRIDGSNAPNGNLFEFMIWAGDGSPDTFRIRIWYDVQGAEIVIYDSGFDQPLARGNVRIRASN